MEISQNDYQKNTAIDMNFFKIQGIAQSSDELIDIFKETPIHELLKQRRQFARILWDKKLIGTQDVEMLKMYNRQLAEFFEIF